MERHQVDLDDLTRVMREGAGANVDFGGQVQDMDFEVLGYDSLALLETATRIGREFDIAVDDDVVSAAHTPRALLKAINDE